MWLVVVKHALGRANLYRQIGESFFEHAMAAIECRIDRNSAGTEQAEYTETDK
jgi:hypothetical protein